MSCSLKINFMYNYFSISKITEHFQILLVIMLLKSTFFKLYLNLPIDITLVIYVLLFLSIFFRPFKFKKNILMTSQSFLVFYLFYIFTITYSLSNDYALWKILVFTLSVISFFIPTFIFEKSSYKLFLKYYKYIYLFGTVAFSFWLSREGNLYKYLSGSIDYLPDYLAIAGYFSISLILFIKEKGLFINIIKLISFLLTIALGGRGPVVLLILMILAYIFFEIRREFSFKKLGIYFSLFITTSFIIFTLGLYETVFGRFEKLYLNIYDEHSNPRIQIYSSALIGISESPFIGKGIGSFGMYFKGEDIKFYPHNLFLEILFETGLVGFCLFTFFLVNIKINLKSIANIELKLVLLFIFLTYMKSNSLDGSRISFLWVGIALSQYNYNKISKNTLKRL